MDCASFPEGGARWGLGFFRIGFKVKDEWNTTALGLLATKTSVGLMAVYNCFLGNDVDVYSDSVRATLSPILDSQRARTAPSSHCQMR